MKRGQYPNLFNGKRPAICWWNERARHLRRPPDLTKAAERQVLYKPKPKHLPGFGIAIGLLVWIFTHLSGSTQQILTYVGVGSVIAALIWGLWKFRAEP